MPKRHAGAWLAAALASWSLLVACLGSATYLDPVPQGLTAQYFPNADEAGPPSDTTIDTDPSTRHLLSNLSGSRPDAFSLRWTGAVGTPGDGIYAFAIHSDSAASLMIDGQVVAQNPGGHGEGRATGSIHLAAGAHALLMRYAHPGGPVLFDWLWSRDGAPMTAVPAWALRARRIRSLARLAARAALDRALALSEWVWVGLLVLAAASIARAGLARVRGSLARTCAWPALAWILAGSCVLNVAGIWWGLPGSWVAIELKPQYVLGALARHFSHGWSDAYPPVHFYVLTAAWSPLLLLAYLDRLTFDSTAAYTLLVLISRFVSIGMAAGLVAAACVCGTRAFGRRAGVIAAATFALTAPFLYYAKTANVDVPYLFWWALSMVYYLRILDVGRTSDYVLFAAAATLSVCTKDQAYGLYLLAPLAIVERLWQEKRGARVERALWRAVFDRRLAMAALTAGALFALCHNLVFNAGGFMDHVRFITGPGSASYRVYDPTFAGHLDLLGQSIRLIEISMGWPLFLAGIVGLVIATATPPLRRLAIWLVVPVVSYYLGFINVILYNYDRFVLPMCFVLAIFGGLAFDRLLSARAQIRRWGVAAVVVAFTYTVAYAGTVDALMIDDSRYAVERWMREHVLPSEVVATTGLHEYLPRLDAYNLEDIGTVAELGQERPGYVVLNADYARAVPVDTPWGQLIAGLERETLGYRLVGRFRHASPWPWLPGAHPDLVGPREKTVVFSTLRNINPTIEIFQRDR